MNCRCRLNNVSLYVTQNCAQGRLRSPVPPDDLNEGMSCAAIIYRRRDQKLRGPTSEPLRFLLILKAWKIYPLIRVSGQILEAKLNKINKATNGTSFAL